MIEKFQNLPLKWKFASILAILFVPTSLLALAFTFQTVHQLEVKTALSGLMNFVDAKQQGVIRFLGATEKKAQELANLVDTAGPDAAQRQFQYIVENDTFRKEDHPFQAEIESGKRKIATWAVYHAIDFVRKGVIEVSSDVSRIGRKIKSPPDIRHGYSDVYFEGDIPILSFGAEGGGGMVYIHANAGMLTLITNGEIGNLEGDMGAYYLAGVGDTFDYYIVNRDNELITDSRAHPDSILKEKGSEFPWMMTMGKAVELGIVCSPDGTYETNAGHITGQYEAMGFYMGHDGEEMLGASMPFYDSQWTMVVEQQASELLGPLYLFNTHLLVITVVTFFTILGTGLLLVTKAAQPLKSLSEAADSLAKGEYDTLLPESGKDEVGKLINAFNSMRQNIFENEDNLIQINAELARAEESMRSAKEDAETANQSKSAFLATMSHEIRTPMTSVIGFADILLDNDLLPDIREKVERIKHSTHSLLRLINDILDMSKLEAGKLEVENINFNLLALIDQTLDMFVEKRKGDGHKGLKVSSTIADNIPEGIFSDPTRLRQVLVNLMGNAVKFTEEGNVTLNLSLDDDVDPEMLRFSVIDTGIGLTEETKEKLFTDFTQADSSITRKYEGTGLGLSICKRLVELMGGEIGVNSQIGEGSTFWFTLPYKEATAEYVNVSKGRSISYAGLRKLNILVAEDNRMNQHIIRAHMEAFGHQVEMVEDGAKALEKHRAKNYDLILMDVRMPVMSGPDATRMIRRLAGDKGNIPIVAITADAMMEHKKGYYEAGMNEVVTKPINRSELLEAINTALGEEVHIASEVQLDNTETRSKEGQYANGGPDPDIEDYLAELEDVAVRHDKEEL